MRIFEKLTSVFTAAVIAFSAAAAVTVSAGADSIYDTAMELSAGKSASAVLPKYNDTTDFKVNVTGSGTLKLSIEAYMSASYVYVFDSDGNKLTTMDCTFISGSGSKPGVKDHYMKWNSAVEKFKGSVSYSVESGTYYIRIYRDFGSTNGSGDVTVTAEFPTSKNTAKLNCITIDLSKGDKLSLGAELTGKGTVTWKSSKPSVASVSSSGKVTAKSKGTAVISATCGKTTKKIKIKVS